MNQLSVVNKQVFNKEDKFVVINGEPWVTSIYIQEVTSKRHDNIMRDIRNIMEESDQDFNQLNFEGVEYLDHKGEKRPMYLLSEDGSSVLLGGYSIAHRVRIQKELREFKNRQSYPQLVDSKLMFQIAKTLEEKEQQVLQLTAKVEEDKPKVLFADSVQASKTTILIGQLAKLIKQNGVDIGQNRLFHWMRYHGYLISRKGSDFNTPTQKSMDMGLFEIKETTINHNGGNISISKTTKVTGKGQLYFINKFLDEEKSLKPANSQSKEMSQ